MYEGVKPDGTIDSDFEFEWFLRTINIESDRSLFEFRIVLQGLFWGVMRLVHNHKWLKDCPKDINLTDRKISVTMEQSENGKMESEILRKWDIFIAESKGGETTEETLHTIIKIMEKFIRARYDIKEPAGLDALALEYKRQALIKEHFVGYKVARS